MGRNFKIIVIDDTPDDILILMQSVAELLDFKYGYNINIEILSKQSEINKLSNMPSDIVMFDCSLSGNSINFEGYDESRFGYELIKKYRHNNKRTKIIFYSGSFDFDDETSINFTSSELIYMINELNIFKVSNRSVESLTESIKDAINNLDTILISMEELISEFGESGQFEIEGQTYSASQLLNELKLGTSIGDTFRIQINEAILAFFMKFGG